jgi:adenosylcobyric acid synthase
LGVVPYLHDLFIPEEDAVALENPFAKPTPADKAIEIVVIHLPRIANFDDFDPLTTEPGVRVHYVDGPEQVGNPAAIIIPGTKSTVNDLAWLRSRGFDNIIQSHAQSGGAVVGICGGYQMLGTMIHDPQHIESSLDSAPGLGLLPIETVFAGDKATHQANAQICPAPGWFAALAGQTVSGYEIHMGRTLSTNPWLEITERNGQAVKLPDGAASENGKIWGCYMHGLFANLNLRRAWLASLGWKGRQGSESANPFTASLTRLADTLEECLDMVALERTIFR